MTILAATDLSENSRPALRYAREFAQALDQTLVVVAVVELWARDMGRLMESFEPDDVKPSQEALDQLRAFVEATFDDVSDIEFDVLVGHPPTDGILREADRRNSTVIVAGTSGHSKIAETFFGSTISALARQSRRPVLAVPPDVEHATIRRILAPVDLSACSERSLKFAGDVARWFDAKLIVYHSAPFGTPSIAPPLVYIPESAEQVRDAATKRVNAMVADANLSGRAEVIIELGPPHGAILRAVEEHNADLIVMGTHGRKGVEKFFLGSTAERILRDRPCPVLVLRDTD